MQSRTFIIRMMSNFFESLYDDLNQELENILEFWSQHTVDSEYGGFVGQVDHHGKIVKLASKGSVLNSRILWTFASSYQKIGSEKLEKLANRAYHYLVNHFWDKEQGGLYWEIDYRGNPLNTRKQAYAQGFGIYAFSEFYRASNNPESLQYAIKLYQLLEAHFNDPEFGGYLEALDKNWQAMDDYRLSAKDANSPKSMNTHLHILEPYTNLYKVWPDPQLKESILQVIHIFLDYVIDHETGHLKLFFDQDWTSHHDIVSFGHSIEGAWLLREAVLEVGDEKLRARVEKASLSMVNAVLKDGVDEDGSLFNERKNGHLDTDKDWWPQAEAMVGLMDAWQISGDENYLLALKKSWEFIQQNLIDYENGEWFGRVNKEANPYENEDKVGFWKCPYHNTRAMLELMKRIQESNNL